MKKTVPEKSKKSKTPSKRRKSRLQRHHEKLLAKQHQPLQRISQDYLKRTKKLFSNELSAASTLPPASSSLRPQPVWTAPTERSDNANRR